MVKVRGRNSNGKTVKQTAEKLARASICDVVVPHWCHLAIMQGHATDSQSRSAGAWHQWLMPAARRRHPRFLAIFGRLFDRLPVRISTSDLHHRILRKKIYHIRAYDFGVQFSFKKQPSLFRRHKPNYPPSPLSDEEINTSFPTKAIYAQWIYEWSTNKSEIPEALKDCKKKTTKMNNRVPGASPKVVKSLQGNEHNGGQTSKKKTGEPGEKTSLKVMRRTKKWRITRKCEWRESSVGGRL